MIGWRLALGLFLAVAAGMAVGRVYDGFRGEPWDAGSDLVISVFAVLGSFFLTRRSAGRKS